MTAGLDPTGLHVPVPRPLGPERCVELLRGITSESRDERWGYAGVAGDWDDEYSMPAVEAAPIGAVLGWAALIETDTEGFTRDDQIGSLWSLALLDRVPRVVLEQVISNLPREELTINQAEGYDLLLGKLQELPPSDESGSDRRPVGPARCVELVRGITSKLPGRRVTWAGVVVECVQAGQLAPHEAGPIAAALGWTSLVETSKTFPNRQRLLRALDLLARADLAPKTVLEQVITELPREELNRDETYLVDALAEQLRRRRGPGPPQRVARCLELLRGITSQYSQERFDAAVAAQHAQLDRYEAGTIATVLGWATVLETDLAGGTRARMLATLEMLARADLVPAPALAQVTSALDTTEVDAYQVLVDRLRQQGDPGQPVADRVAVGPTHCVKLVRRLVDQDPHWAAVPARWLAGGELDTHEASTIATVLSWAALLEPSDLFPTRHRVLHSLALLARHDLAPPSTLEQVTANLARPELDDAEAGLYDSLADQLGKYT